MKKIKKRYLVTFSLFFLLGIIVAVLIIYFPNLFKRTVIPKTVDVFGAPRSQIQQSFPSDNPKYTAVIGSIKPESVHQQSISIYQIGDTKKTMVFTRPFYADGFRGNDLTYTLSSSSASITQRGTLSSLGCKTADCKLSWSNYYIWDPSAHTFVLDNVNHKNDFQQLLATYQAVDKKGCNIIGGEILPNQDGLSFTELYKKYPTTNYYCSETQGILPTNLVFFLQAEKTLQEIVSGQNIGSADIRGINL